MKVKLLECLVAQEHVESWHMYSSKRPLTTEVRIALLIVNSVKLHLTAYKASKSAGGVGQNMGMDS